MSVLEKLSERLTGKKKGQISEETVIQKSNLETLCGEDKQTYEALEHTMFLDPRKITTSMEEATNNANKYVEQKNPGRARICFDIAGGLAIYKGDVARVMEYFGRSQEISGMKYPILQNPETAVAKAQEYYKKYLK